MMAMLVNRLLSQLLQAAHYNRQQIAHLMGEVSRSEGSPVDKQSRLHLSPQMHSAQRSVSLWLHPSLGTWPDHRPNKLLISLRQQDDVIGQLLAH